MESIPFLIPVGTEYPGLIRLESRVLVLEFKQWSWKSFSKRLKEVELPISDIVAVQFNARMWGTSLELQVRSMRVLEEIPHNKPAVLKLQFARKHREAAQALASAVSLKVSEQKLARMDNDWEL